MFQLAFSSDISPTGAKRKHSTVRQLASSAVKINKSLHYGKTRGGTQAATLQGSEDGQSSAGKATVKPLGQLFTSLDPGRENDRAL